MNTWQKLSVATAGAALIVLEAVSGAQAVTLASASLGSTNPGDGFTVDANQFLGWRFQVNNTLQVQAIGGNLKMGSGSIFGAIVALGEPDGLPQGKPFLPGEVLTSKTFDSTNLAGDVRIPLSVTLAPGNYGLVYGSSLLGAAGSAIMPYNNSDFSASSYFICSNCTSSASGNWSNSQISNVRFVVEGNADTPVPQPTTVPQPTIVPEPTPVSKPATVPEPSSALCMLAFGSLAAGMMLRKGGTRAKAKS